MALPAGRYGVTKRQLNKIKNLPVNTIGMIEAAVEDVTDLMEDTVGWLGKNLVTTITEGYSIREDGTISENAGFNYINNCEVTPFETYKFKARHTAEGAASYRVHGYDASDNWVKQIAVSSISAIADFEIKFEIDNPSIKYVKVSMPTSTSNYEVSHISVDEQKADISALGTQEGATASRLYHPGEHFYKDGKFCTVIGSADVASGATWTLNTNYVVGTIADNLVYKPGDSIVISPDNVNQVPVEGYFTVGGKAIFVFIRTNRPLSGVTGVSFSNSSKIYARGIAGYVVQGIALNTLVMEFRVATDLGVMVAFSKTDETAFDGANNTPLDIALSDCTITFS